MRPKYYHMTCVGCSFTKLVVLGSSYLLASDKNVGKDMELRRGWCNRCENVEMVCMFPSESSHESNGSCLVCGSRDTERCFVPVWEPIPLFLIQVKHSCGEHIVLREIGRVETDVFVIYDNQGNVLRNDKKKFENVSLTGLATYNRPTVEELRNIGWGHVEEQTIDKKSVSRLNFKRPTLCEQESTVEKCKQQIDSLRDSIDAWLKIVPALRKLGRIGEAKLYAGRATELFPGMGETWRNLALTYIDLQKREDAQIALECGAKMDLNSEELLKRLDRYFPATR